MVDGYSVMIPMATTEGALVASTHRGCRAMNQSGGVRTVVVDKGMTRGPVVKFPSAARSAFFKEWLENPENFEAVAGEFNTTSRFARLKNVGVCPNLHLNLS